MIDGIAFNKPSPRVISGVQKSTATLTKLTLLRLHEICEPFEVEYACAAFDGDADAAFNFYCSLGNDMRGAVAVAMWRCKVPVSSFRVCLRLAWTHDHQFVIQAAKRRKTLGFMFRYADFDLPEDTPEVLTIWRGTSNLAFDDAVNGYSWTTDRDTACWFAMRHAGQGRTPLVLKAQVAKREIMLLTNERYEHEVVVIRLMKARIDGDASDWEKCFHRKQCNRNQNDLVARSSAANSVTSDGYQVLQIGGAA